MKKPAGAHDPHGAAMHTDARRRERARERSSARLSKLFIAVLRPLYSKRRLECTPLGKVRAASVSHTHIARVRARGLSFMITRAARKYATEQPGHVHVSLPPSPADGASVRPDSSPWLLQQRLVVPEEVCESGRVTAFSPSLSLSLPLIPVSTFSTDACIAQCAAREFMREIRRFRRDDVR